MFNMVPPALSIGEIFGIFFIVLIIQFSYDIFSDEERFRLKLLGVFCVSSSLSAIAWLIITQLVESFPTIITDFLVPKPLLFFILLGFLLVVGIVSYLYSMKTKKK